MLIIRAAAGVADIMPWNEKRLRVKPYRCVPVWRGFAGLQAVHGFEYTFSKLGLYDCGCRHNVGFHRLGAISPVSI
jgi:hypothetical protein